MITLKEAIRKIEAETGCTVDTVKDCQDRWAFNFVEYRNEEYDENADWLTRALNMTTGNLNATIRKTDGESKYYFDYDFIILTQDAEVVEMSI